MSRAKLSPLPALVVGLVLSAAASGADRPVDAIVKELEGLRPPVLDRSKLSDNEFRKAYSLELEQYMTRSQELTRELYHADPDHPKVPALLLSFWRRRVIMSPALSVGVAEEIDEALPHFKDPKLVMAARAEKVRALMRTRIKDDPAAVVAELDRYLADYPKDELGGRVLEQVMHALPPSKLKDAARARLDQEFEGGLKARREKAEEAVARRVLGKPLDLEFKDAVNGTEVSLAALKGKVVVLDFWATWCGPCVAEMPKMKDLYSRFKGQGVEFIGISLDTSEEEGGLKNLKAYVAKNEIAWPQHYDGKGWETPLVQKFGIQGIPTLVLIDAEGKVASLKARGQLETLIPEHLAKAKNKVAANAR